jgi:GxxExxY protein
MNSTASEGSTMHENELATHVVDCSFKLHNQYGPGIFEKPYEAMLAHELAKRGIHGRRQVPCPLVHDGLVFDEAYRIDLLVEEKLIVELKSVDKLEKCHFKQVQTYLKLQDRRLGLLINFGEALIKDGIHRVVNGLEENA